MYQIAQTSPATTAALAQLKSWGEVAREALAANTQRAYRLDAERFASWCKAQGAVSMPAAPETVAAFLRGESEAGRAVATVRRRAATIAAMHRGAGVANPCEAALVRMAIKGLARSRGTDQRQAAPITEREAMRITAGMGDTLRDARDLALLLVGRDLLARASELVALRVEDVTAAEDGGAVVALRRFKTATAAAPVYIGPEARTALEAWLRRAAITTGPVFRAVHKSERLGARAISPRDVSRILKARAVAAKLPAAAGVSSHSLRVGMAQDLAAANLELPAIMQAGGWASSAMVSRYTAQQAATRGAVARFYGRR